MSCWMAAMRMWRAYAADAVTRIRERSEAQFQQADRLLATVGVLLRDFAKAEEPWVDDLTRAIADGAATLAQGDDAGFQNRVHLAMEARGWTDVKRPGERADD